MWVDVEKVLGPDSILETGAQSPGRYPKPGPQSWSGESLESAAPMLLFNVGMFPEQPTSQAEAAADGGVNGHKAEHKAKHLLLKEEAERQRDRDRET